MLITRDVVVSLGKVFFEVPCDCLSAWDFVVRKIADQSRMDESGEFANQLRLNQISTISNLEYKNHA